MTATPYPWQAGPSLLEFLRGWSGEETCDLPDESNQSNLLFSFAPGALDGVLGHHMRGVNEQQEARFVSQLLEALFRLIRKDDDTSRARLYELLCDESFSLLQHIDVLMSELAQQSKFGPLDVRPHARWLVRHSAHRQPLKFGIALLGMCGDPEVDLDDLRLLARHDEFTLYASVAAVHLVDDPIAEWWQMAQRVSGWGKVHLVERLCQYAGDNQALRGWLLRHGCANQVMPEYLALICAVAGGLAEALSDDEIDEELLDGASVIFTALLSTNSPAGDINDYAQAPVAVTEMIRHLEKHCNSLRRLILVKQFADWFAESDEAVWQQRQERGWSRELMTALLERCRAILARPEWPEQLRTRFVASNSDRYLAWELAPAIGIDLWPEAFACLQQHPQDSWLYQCLLQDDSERADRILAFAEQRLPLASVATGPANLMGLGKGFEVHDCLDRLLQRMGQGDVFSEAIVTTALRSPVVRNRNLAAGVVEMRPVETWGPAIVQTLRANRDDETDESLRERWGELLGKLPTEAS